MNRIVDLSVEVRAGDHTLPPPAQRGTEISQYRMEGAVHWQGSYISTTTHVGSHVDSPLHVVADGPTIGEIAIDRVVGEASIMDLRPIEANQAIDASLLEQRYTNEIRPGDIVVLRTDWTDRHWGTREYWSDSPYLTEDGARWLGERGPKAVAMDFFEEHCARFTEFAAEEFVVHLVLLQEYDVLLIENITNVGALGSDRVEFFAAPVKIMEAEGAPARVFAIEDSH